MTRKEPTELGADIQGATRLAFEATSGITDMVEVMHSTISRAPGILGKKVEQPTKGITGLVYRTIRSVIGSIGQKTDLLMDKLAPVLDIDHSGEKRDLVLATLNGVLGDYLHEKENPLVIPLVLKHNGKVIDLDIASQYQEQDISTGKLLIAVHGLCMCDQLWTRSGHNHGMELSVELGYVPIFTSYNSGLHISTNGQGLADRIEKLVAQWPVEVTQIDFIGYSMGGLIIRSACEYGSVAEHTWRSKLKNMIFLGSPHHGAPLERAGNLVDILLEKSPYTAPIACLGKRRSSGITDLRFGYLLDEDWLQIDPSENSDHKKQSVPLPEDVRSFAIAGSRTEGSNYIGQNIIGDGLVPVKSALGIHDNPKYHLNFAKDNQHIVRGTHHLDLLSSQEAYQKMLDWLRPRK